MPNLKNQEQGSPFEEQETKLKLQQVQCLANTIC
jgi:hypothetical protein